MNNRILLCVFPVYSKQFTGRRYTKFIRTGSTAAWSTPEKLTKFNRWMPFQTKMFGRVHTMVHHDALAGNTRSWKCAARRMEAHMPQFAIQHEWY